MPTYKVIKGCIEGRNPGQTVNLSEEMAGGYGPDYVEEIDSVQDPVDPEGEPNTDKSVKGAEKQKKDSKKKTDPVTQPEPVNPE